MNEQETVIIVGGGIAGLIAARQLSATGREIILLEANSRFGGRIYSVNDPRFDTVLEAGAEFVHGELPLTLSLLKEAGIPFYKSAGKMAFNKNGEFIKGGQGNYIDMVLEKMNELKEDISFDEFLNTYFGGEKNLDLRQSMTRYANGFDLADTALASTLGLKDEWEKEEEISYRVDGGYSGLVDFLKNTCVKNGVVLQQSCVVNKISWQNNKVEVSSACGSIFTADKVIVAVPVSMLCNNKVQGLIEFDPPLPAYNKAAADIGFGSVIKIFLQFKEMPFAEDLKNISIIISNQPVPTWWTQLPQESNMLVGWLGGPGAKALHHSDEKAVLHLALESLAQIFSTGIDQMEENLAAWKIVDWSAMPFAGGAYSWPTLETEQARKILQQPVNNTIFFAGEAVYKTSSPGTVEAAIQSGLNASEAIIASQHE